MIRQARPELLPYRLDRDKRVAPGLYVLCFPRSRRSSIATRRRVPTFSEYRPQNTSTVCSAKPQCKFPHPLSHFQISWHDHSSFKTTTTPPPQHHHCPTTLGPASNEVSNHERVTTVHCERESPLMNEQFFFFVVGQLNLFSTYPPLKITRPPSHRKTCRTSSSLASAPRSCIAPARSKSAKAQAPFCSGRAWRGRSSARSSDGFAAEKSGASGRRA